jgi:hypothetical protein
MTWRTLCGKPYHKLVRGNALRQLGVATQVEIESKR